MISEIVDIGEKLKETDHFEYDFIAESYIEAKKYDIALQMANRIRDAEKKRKVLLQIYAKTGKRDEAIPLLLEEME